MYAGQNAYCPTNLVPEYLQKKYANMNDITGLSFLEIADEIEKDRTKLIS